MLQIIILLRTVFCLKKRRQEQCAQNYFTLYPSHSLPLCSPPPPLPNILECSGVHNFGLGAHTNCKLFVFSVLILKLHEKTPARCRIIQKIKSLHRYMSQMTALHDFLGKSLPISPKNRQSLTTKFDLHRLQVESPLILALLTQKDLAITNKE